MNTPILAYLIPALTQLGLYLLAGGIVGALLIIVFRGSAWIAALGIVALVWLTNCTPELTPEQQAARDAEVSRSLIESRHHFDRSDSMSGPGNQ